MDLSGRAFQKLMFYELVVGRSHSEASGVSHQQLRLLVVGEIAVCTQNPVNVSEMGILQQLSEFSAELGAASVRPA
jgi:hypothetical protein